MNKYTVGGCISPRRKATRRVDNIIIAFNFSLGMVLCGSFAMLLIFSFFGK